MTQKELIKILTFISNSYPHKFNFPCEDDADSKAIINTWATFLKDYDYKIVQTAVKKIIVNKPEWPPAVGELVREIENLQKSDDEKLTAGEAWEKVTEAIARHSYFYNPSEVKEALPEKALRAAEVVGFELIARKGGDSYVMNSYTKVYNNLEEKREKFELLPESVRKEVDELAEKFTILQIEGED